jgi:hypothetical protein
VIETAKRQKRDSQEKHLDEPISFSMHLIVFKGAPT